MDGPVEVGDRVTLIGVRGTRGRVVAASERTVLVVWDGSSCVRGHPRVAVRRWTPEDRLASVVRRSSRNEEEMEHAS